MVTNLVMVKLHPEKIFVEMAPHPVNFNDACKCIRVAIDYKILFTTKLSRYIVVEMCPPLTSYSEGQILCYNILHKII